MTDSGRIEIDCNRPMDVDATIDGIVIVMFHDQPYSLHIKNARKLAFQLLMALGNVEKPYNLADRTWRRAAGGKEAQ